MTVQSIDPQVIYDGDAVTRVFPFGFDMAAESSLRVSFVSLGLVETVVPPEDYSVTRFSQGGEVTFDDAPPADVKVVLTRRTPFTQQVSVTAQTAYDPRVVESVWDKLTVVSQELAMAQQTMLRGAPGTDPTGIYEEIMMAADTASESVGLAVGAKEAAEQAAQVAVEAAANLSSVVRYNAQTLTAPQQAQARDNIGAADSATAVVNTRTVTAGTGLTGGGDLTEDRTIAADFATEAEALAGVASDKVMSPARVAQVAGKHYWQFTASGTWTKPAGLPDDAMVFVEAWGGGQSGGRDSSDFSGRRGGNGGSYVSAWFRVADLPSAIPVTVGAGGAARTSNGSGNNGGSTSFGALLSAPGGGATQGPPVTDSGGSPGGGGTTPSVGGNALRAGAGGGGSGATSGAAGGVSRFGGNGGAGNGSTGDAGEAPGGGGGGAGGTSGAGARGEVRIWI